MKVQSLSVALVIISGVVLALPAKTYAFWPFDVFTKNNLAGGQSKFPDVIQRIIDKFKLDSGEVAKVVEEVRAERQQEIRARKEARLEEAIKAGVITNEQKQALLDKEAEWQAKQQELIQERRQWMEESGIDFKKLAPYWGFGGRDFGNKTGRKGKFGW